MNTHLLKLLKFTPGVVHGRLGVRRRMIDQSEYADILTMKNSTIAVNIGDWVVVKTGLYKGDVALVIKTSSWGARLLLVPRIGTQLDDHNHKRKRSNIKPTAELFDPSYLQCPVLRWKDEEYLIGTLYFQQGLLVKDFDYHSVGKTANDIPHQHYTMFRLSKHPEVILSRMPYPREWRLKEHDKVVILSSGESGTLKAVHPFYAEVEIVSDRSSGLPPLQWNEHVPWHDIKKSISIGQYVLVKSGFHIGKSGWVVSLLSEAASVAVKTCEGSTIYNEDSIEVRHQ